MIERIDLRYFKCFEMLQLPVCPLTLLAGANASGKSAIMQALVLLHQTIREHEWSMRLMLNGNVIRLGTVADVIDQVHGRDECKIALLDDDRFYDWTFEGERQDMSMRLAHVVVDGKEGMPPPMFFDWDERYQYPHQVEGTFYNLLPPPHGDDSLARRLRRLTYLKAERLGPREVYPLEEDPQGAQVVGPGGEQAVSVLYTNRDNLVTNSLCVPSVSPTLQRQVEARMAQFFPGYGMEIGKISRANSATLGLRTSAITDFHRPVHTGFGLTQVFPIVVAALSAMPGELLLIENPEVHLHPAGQAAMGEFLAEVASVGVQVMIETHSDHVLNGIRRAVKSGVLPCEDAAIHFFRPRSEEQEEGAPQVESPTIDANGNLDDWPDGFFDQFDKDMNYFAGWS